MKKIIEQALSFVGLSGIGWLLDFFIYTGLGLIMHNLVLNNFISSWVGVTFVFTFATRKIFHNDSNISLAWKYLLYLGYQMILIFFISKLLNSINTVIIDNINVEIIKGLSPIIAKILVTPITMILNFIVMKFVIEKW